MSLFPKKRSARHIRMARSVFAFVAAFAASAGLTEEDAARSADSAFEPGIQFRDCDDCPEMIVLPAGSFTMGSPKAEASRDEDEGPRHAVEISYSFAVSKYEITINQFQHFVKSNPNVASGPCRAWEGGEWASKWVEREDRSWKDPGYDTSDAHPVVCVGWPDAHAYVDWLRQLTGEPYRLLSEAEWEYAARGGAATQFHFGNRYQDICRFGNVADRSMRARWAATGCDDGYGETTSPVGSYLPNGFGLFDIHGNVWEWVEDCWNDSFAGAPADGRAWRSGDCERRVSRGGAWDTVRSSARSSNRRWNTVGYKISNTGIRVARDLPE